MLFFFYIEEQFYSFKICICYSDGTGYVWYATSYSMEATSEPTRAIAEMNLRGGSSRTHLSAPVSWARTELAGY